jgi:hypothetical protein
MSQAIPTLRLGAEGPLPTEGDQHGWHTQGGSECEEWALRQEGPSDERPGPHGYRNGEVPAQEELSPHSTGDPDLNGAAGTSPLTLRRIATQSP